MKLSTEYIIIKEIEINQINITKQSIKEFI